MVIGIVLTILAGAMLPSMLADLADGHRDWQVFFLTAALTALGGVSLLLVNAGPPPNPKLSSPAEPRDGIAPSIPAAKE